MSTPNEHCDKQLVAWIGLARVEPRAGNTTLGSAAGAVVPIVALAYSQDGFVARTVAILNECDFEVAEIEDIEPIAERLNRCDVASHIVELADSLTEDSPVAFGTFQVYRHARSTPDIGHE